MKRKHQRPSENVSCANITSTASPIPASRLCVIVDSREHALIGQLHAAMSIADEKHRAKIVVGTLDVADVIVCKMAFATEVLELAKEHRSTFSKTAPGAWQAGGGVGGGGGNAHCKNKGDRCMATMPYVYNPILSILHTSHDASERQQQQQHDSRSTHTQLCADGEEQACVYIPLVAIERKTDSDLIQSIHGSAADRPGFSRFSDQKIRLKRLQYDTGCMLMLATERSAHNEMRGDVQRNTKTLATAHLNTMLRDKIFVCAGTDVCATANTIANICRQVVEKKISNYIFPTVFARLYDGAEQRPSALCGVETRGVCATGADGSPGTPTAPSDHCVQSPLTAATTHTSPTESRGTKKPLHVGDSATCALLERRRIQSVLEDVHAGTLLTDAVHATHKVVTGHSHAVSVRKRDNVDARMCFRMMLMCTRGVSEPMASAILLRYETMADLVRAYQHSCVDEKQRQLLVAAVPIENARTSSGKPRKIGPVVSKRIYRALCTTDSTL